MSTKKFRFIFYIIAIAIVSTIAVQLYWNYLNYKENKQQVANEILLSLDNAVEAYYSNLTKNSFVKLFPRYTANSVFLTEEDKEIFKKSKVESKIRSVKITTNKKLKDSWPKSSIPIDSFFLKDSVKKRNLPTINVKPNKKSELESLESYKPLNDTLNFEKGIKQILVAFTNNNINFFKLDSIFKKELQVKNIGTDYYFNFYVSDTLQTTTKPKNFTPYKNSLEAKSTYLRNQQSLLLFYDSTTYEALKKSFTGILISLFLALVIISSLFYLLHIIKNQKELASIKNDLISNITHEFKTPIATVSTAIEAISNFNAIDDKEKTQKYLAMSSIQLDKLHLMVEKLLETATLDSEKLILKKENIDATELMVRLVEKYKVLAPKKNIQFTCNTKPIYLDVDVFHFENVISNLLDNAVKYGGEDIDININQILGATEISIADNGKGIEKHQQDKIFDKFYRVPKGNTHNVKGFGIGLYYCKKIIEKHDGSLSLISSTKQTVFKITFSNEKD